MINPNIEIGGYFELERTLTGNNVPHLLTAICLNSGRNAFEYILLALSNVSKVFIPYFTCDTVLEPVVRHNIPYEFYHLDDQLDPIFDFSLLKNGEYIIYTNYWGLKDKTVQNLLDNYSHRLIIDSTQALFSNYGRNSNCFYSPRKFVGLPDGGFAYTLFQIQKQNELERDLSYDRMLHILKRVDLGAKSAYSDFSSNSRSLSNQPIKEMSNLTKHLYSQVDFELVKNRRLENFRYLHQALKATNHLNIDEYSLTCPMIYPYMTNNEELRKLLISKGIFVATYWPNVFEWCDEQDIEYSFANNIIPLPIDQRYTKVEMDYILKYIL